MTHSEIIIKSGGIKVCSDKLNMPYVRVAAWKNNNSIPARYWHEMQECGISTIEELAAATAKEGLPE